VREGVTHVQAKYRELSHGRHCTAPGELDAAHRMRAIQGWPIVSHRWPK
jgi:hypothetical protein